ncbi:C40 family peptidase [Dermacoccus nishinomiyaensis]|uniref:C40 family peptidase n=1 Tax=Dermacoccus nishinomiyaensis TaxID=1274 RepID=UPI00237B5E74|nr:C40 family peptidase [Dermacoccus nishinomiyaensis]
MSIKNTPGPLRPVKQTRTLAMLTTTVAVSGGLVAGLGITQSAGAAPESGAVHEAAAAATTPLELKTVTPAKKLVVAPKAAAKAAAKPAAAKKSTRATSQALKQVSRSQARSALTSASVKPVKAERKAKIAEPVQRRSIVVKKRTAPAASQSTNTHRAASQSTNTHRAASQSTNTHRAASQSTNTHRAASQSTNTQRATATHQRVHRTHARQAVSQHTQARPVAQTPRHQQAPVHRATVRHATTTHSVTPTYASSAQKATNTASASRSNSGVVSIAAGLTGIPYVYGGSSTSGADCSGYVAMVFAKAGIQLPHQSGAIKAMTTPVSDPRPGDLVFLPGHVAIYAGNGMVYEARHPGTVTGLYPVLSGSTYGRL